MEHTIPQAYPEKVLVKGSQYLPMRELGSSSFGIVILYQNQITGEKMVLKALQHNSQQGTQSKESQHMAKIQQLGLKHAPKFYGEGYHNNQPYFVMEYIEYSVEEYLGLTGTSVAEIGQQMLQALRELHDHGFLHQDIQPGNFRVMSGGLVKIQISSNLIEFKPNDRLKASGQCGSQSSSFFVSISSLEGHAPCRKDDLESLGYYLMQLAYGEGKVLWSNMQEIKDQGIQHRERRASISREAPHQYAQSWNSIAMTFFLSQVY